MENSAPDCHAQRPPLIILIHGTWAHGFLRSILSHFGIADRLIGQRPKVWSEGAGEFRRRIASEVPVGTRIESFSWTGYNSIGAPRDAATDLAAKIVDASKIYVGRTNDARRIRGRDFFVDIWIAIMAYCPLHCYGFNVPLRRSVLEPIFQLMSLISSGGVKSFSISASGIYNLSSGRSIR